MTGTVPDPAGAGAANEAPKKSILRTTLLVMPAIAVFRVGELFLPLLLVYWFGLTSAMDLVAVSKGAHGERTQQRNRG